MVQGDAELQGGRPTDLVSLGALTSLVPRTMVDEAIAVTDAHEVRRPPSPQARVVTISECAIHAPIAAAIAR